MKCPNCKVDMNKGTLLNHGMIWSSKKQIGASVKLTKLLTGGIPVSAYQCSNCKNIQLKSEE